VSREVHDPHCIFCKIIRGEIPAAKVIETARAVAFLDIHPVTHGHTLLVPRSHHPRLADVPEELAAHAGSLLPHLCRAIAAATGAPGLNVVMNNGRVAGQTIDHCHWHIIPRFNDDPVSWAWPQGEYVGDELSQMRFRIERELNLDEGSNR
jgi:histidine triad (HIT) family protein